MYLVLALFVMAFAIFGDNDSNWLKSETFVDKALEDLEEAEVALQEGQKL